MNMIITINCKEKDIEDTLFTLLAQCNGSEPEIEARMDGSYLLPTGAIVEVNEEELETYHA